MGGGGGGGGGVVRGQVGLFIAVLFPYTRNFATHCISSPSV